MLRGLNSTPDRQQSMVHDWRLWSVVAAITILVGIVMTLTPYYFGGSGRQFRELVQHSWPIWVTRGLLVPVVFGLASRLHRTQILWRRTILHLLGAFAYSSVHLAGAAGIAAFFMGNFSTADDLLQGYMRSVGFPLDFLCYGGTVGLFYAVHFYSESQRALIASARLQTSFVEAQLHALRSQLNPHFLFNTINTISVLALKGDCLAVVETIERLSDLLRVALDETRPESIPLREELKFVDNQLEIQRLRLGDRLIICREIDPDALEALVPSMILQPLVENAIKYGVSVGTGVWRITIRATRQNGTLRLQVCDSGPGFRENATRKGIGLASTEARLECLYGKAHRIEYSHGSRDGGLVAISIPFSQANVITAAAPSGERE
jgi:signal transduction histidine kinase